MTDSFQFSPRNWHLAHGRILQLGSFAKIMGVLNVTPDSFSDGGEFINLDDGLKQCEKMIAEGADIIDVGGESTRPGAKSIDGDEERGRVLPIIEGIAKRFDVVISIDTYRAKTAKAALQAGAHIINDVWGLQKEPEIAQIAKTHDAGLCIMHTSRERKVLADVIEDQKLFFEKSLKIANQNEIKASHIVLDPGFGFAKNPQENLQLLARLDELHGLNFPLLIGTSRKRFLAALMEDGEANRDGITAASSIAARLSGGAVFRVHDVKKNKEALALADGIIHAAVVENLPDGVRNGER